MGLDFRFVHLVPDKFQAGTRRKVIPFFRAVNPGQEALEKL
jgi:hypothetical protein